MHLATTTSNADEQARAQPVDHQGARTIDVEGNKGLPSSESLTRPQTLLSEPGRTTRDTPSLHTMIK